MAPIGPNRPQNWSCPVTAPSTAKASCVAIDALNDYGEGRTVATGVNADLASMNASDPTLQLVRARNQKAGNAPAPALQDSARIIVDTTPWVSSAANQKPAWYLRPWDAVLGNSDTQVVEKLAQAKRSAAEFVRNLYAQNGGQLKDPITGEPMVVKIVPIDSNKVSHGPNLLEGHFLPWSENDNLRKTADGIEIGIDASMNVPSANELMNQWNKGMQFDDETMRTAWKLLNPNGTLQSGIGLLHGALKTTLGNVAKTLIKDLSDVQGLLGKDESTAKGGGVNIPVASVGPSAGVAPALKLGGGTPVDAEQAAREQLLSVVRKETQPAEAGKGKASPAREPVEKIINSMSRKELRAFVAAWTKRLEDPKSQDDAISAAAQITRNTIIKSKADASGGKYNIAISNGHDIDIVAQVAAKGNGLRFTHLVDAPVQTVDIQSQATAVGGPDSRVNVAVSTTDAIRVFAQVGGVLNETKVLSTGTMREALNEFIAARKAAKK